MKIIRAKVEDLTPQALECIKRFLTESFDKRVAKRKFSWQTFISQWEAALLFPWNAFWFLVDDEDTEQVYGYIGGTVFTHMTTGMKIATEIGWSTAKEVKGKSYGWDLLATFMEWAVKEQGADRIVTHRYVSKDFESDERFDKKVREFGFSPLGCEYYMDMKEGM